MVATDAAIILVATTLVVLTLLTLATIYYVPKVLSSHDEHGHEEHDHEGNEQAAGGRPA